MEMNEEFDNQVLFIFILTFDALPKLVVSKLRQNTHVILLLMQP